MELRAGITAGIGRISRNNGEKGVDQAAIAPGLSRTVNNGENSVEQRE